MMEEKLVTGNNFSICIDTKTEEESQRIFNALSEGGTVVMPLGKTLRSPSFGMLTDKFGISWMVGSELKQE